MKARIKPSVNLDGTEKNKSSVPVISIVKELEFQQKIITAYNRKDKSVLSFFGLFQLVAYVNDNPEGIKIAKVDVPFLTKYIIIKIIFVNTNVFTGHIEL